MGGGAVGDERDGNGKRADAVFEWALGLERERLPRDLEYKPAVVPHHPEHLAGGRREVRAGQRHRRAFATKALPRGVDACSIAIVALAKIDGALTAGDGLG